MCFDRFLSDSERAEGDRTSQAFPWKGKGDRRRRLSETLKIQAKGEEFLAKSNLCRGWMRLTFPFAKLTPISPTAKHHSPQGYIISEGNIICRRQTSLPPTAAWGMRLTKSPKVKSFSLPVNPLRHGGRTRRATSPYYGEAALRASPIKRAYKTRAVRYSQAVLSRTVRRRKGWHFSSLPLEGEGGPSKTVDEVDLSFCKTNLHFANGETS